GAGRGGGGPQGGGGAVAPDGPPQGPNAASRRSNHRGRSRPAHVDAGPRASRPPRTGREEPPNRAPRTPLPSDPSPRWPRSASPAQRADRARRRAFGQTHPSRPPLDRGPPPHRRRSGGRPPPTP